MKYILSLLILSFRLLGDSLAQENHSSFIPKLIHKQASILLKNKEIRSVSIGIYHDGKTYLQHFGELNKEAGDTPTDETIYEIGSVTKTMVGFLVAKAVQEKKIRLDEDVRKYLTGNYPNLEFNSKPITVEHLLTHTSGLPAFLPLEMNEVFQTLDSEVPAEYREIEQSYNRQAFWEDLYKVALTREPGSSYSYSNVGAELAGHILETIYEKSIDLLLKESLFKEAEMPHTGIVLNELQKQQLAPGYWMDNTTPSPCQLNTLWAAGGGVKSTLPDLINYAKFQLDDRNIAVFKTHQVLYKEGKTLKSGYFWRIWTDKYGVSYNHHGGTTGTQNWVYIYPKYNLGMIIITNHSGPKTPNKLSKSGQKLLKGITGKKVG